MNGTNLPCQGPKKSARPSTILDSARRLALCPALRIAGPRRRSRAVPRTESVLCIPLQVAKGPTEILRKNTAWISHAFHFLIFWLRSPPGVPRPAEERSRLSRQRLRRQFRRWRFDTRFSSQLPMKRGPHWMTSFRASTGCVKNCSGSLTTMLARTRNSIGCRSFRPMTRPERDFLRPPVRLQTYQ